MPSTATQFVESYLDVVNAADTAALARLYEPDARIFDAMGAWELTGQAWSQRIDEWMSECRPGGTSRVTDLTATGDDGPLAVVVATITYETEFDGGGSGSCTLRATFVLRRHSGGWRITHEHTSFPVTMESDPSIITYQA